LAAQPPPPQPEEQEDSDDAVDPSDQAAVVRGRVVVERGLIPQTVTISAQRTAADGGTEDNTEMESKYESDGAFEVDLEPGTYRLLFRAQGWVPAAVEGVSLAAGDDIRGVEVVLDSGGRVSGRVISAPDDAPATSQIVTLTGHGFSLRTFTDDSGDFMFDGIPLQWEGRPLELFAEAVDSSHGSDRQTVRSGDTVTLRLDRRRRVSGEVVGPDGQPVAHASVLVGTPVPSGSAVDRDPYGERREGESFGIIGFGLCSEWPECRAAAQTDDAGRFEVPVADVEGLRLAAVSGALRSPPVATAADGSAVRLILTEQPRVRLRAVRQKPGSDSPLFVFCTPTPPELEFASTSARAVDESGEVDLPLWPGVPCAVGALEGVSVLAAGPVPEGVDLGEAGPDGDSRDAD
jgi:hypothetical protein